MNLRRLAFFIVLSSLPACNGSGDKDKGENGGTEISLSPGIGGLGTSLTVDFVSNDSVFDFGRTEADFGDGIAVDRVVVNDAWTATADLTIDPDAELGLRDVEVSTGSRAWTLAESFNVIASSFRVAPDSAMLGETLTVTIEGVNTEWEQGLTWPSFGDGVDILEFVVYARTVAEATVSVGADSTPGPRDVLMENGPDVLTLYDGFQVDRVGMAASFDPSEAEQGDTVEFTIVSLGTNFSDSRTQLSFWENGIEKSDIQVDQINVLDATNLYGVMTLSNAAELGPRDVLIETGGEGVMVPDAFTVVESPINLEEVAVSIAFEVQRGIDNSSGAIGEAVIAQAIFYIPLDPPCGSSPMGSGPMPYDANGVFAIPTSEPEDCPTPRTVGAGEYVWFESPANVVTMERYEDPGSGMIYYAGNVTMDDYVCDQWYDLHTQGEDGGVAEWLIPEIQPTVPADFQLLNPQIWGDFTWSRAADFTYTWTPAQTYPDALFVTGVQGTLVETGEGGFVGSVPWDDGEHTYLSSELSALNAGPVYFYALSSIEGVEFGLPNSIYQTNKTGSMIYIQGYMVLE